MDNRSDIWRGVDTIKPRFVALSDKVWGIPEVCYTEARSAAEHLAELRHQGFRITENVADIPTALMGEAGEGGPVIAFHTLFPKPGRYKIWAQFKRGGKIVVADFVVDVRDSFLPPNVVNFILND